MPGTKKAPGKPIRVKRANKMELLQSQAPAERELLGNSAVRTLDIRV